MADGIGVEIEDYEVMQSTVNDEVLLIICRISGDITEDTGGCLGVIAA
jgi:hypothetical protein